MARRGRKMDLWTIEAPKAESATIIRTLTQEGLRDR
jgi:hypothetical protein